MLTLVSVANKCKRRHKYIVGHVNVSLKLQLTAFWRQSFFRPSSPCFVPYSLWQSSEPGSPCQLTPLQHRNNSVSPQHLLKLPRWSNQSCSSRRRYAIRKLNLCDRGFHRLCAKGVCVSIYNHNSDATFPSADHRHPGSENRDKIEVYLAFGASRLEACRPIAKQALRLALTPMISQMRLVHCAAITHLH